jgi:hypothetical protein
MSERFDDYSIEQRLDKRDLIIPEVKVAVANLAEEFKRQYLEPAGGDAWQAGFSRIVGLDLERDIPSDPAEAAISTKPIILNGLNVRYMTGDKLTRLSALTGLIQRAYINQTMQGHPDIAAVFMKGFDENFSEEQKISYATTIWREAIRAVNSSTWSDIGIGGRLGVETDIATRNVQTVRTEREVFPKLLVALMTEKLGRPTRIIEIGCSRNHGLKYLGLGLPFHKVNVLQLAYSRSQLVDRSREDLTREFNGVVDRNIPIGPSLGIDLYPYRDEGFRQWARSNSFYLQELQDPTVLDEYDMLDAADVQNVSYSDINLLKEDLDPSHEGQYDIAIFNTMLHQLSSPENVATMLNKIEKYLNPQTGVITIQDFARVNLELPNGLEFFESWWDKQFPYRAILIDPFDPSEGPQEIMHWTSARCKTGRIVDYKDFAHTYGRLRRLATK